MCRYRSEPIAAYSRFSAFLWDGFSSVTIRVVLRLIASVYVCLLAQILFAGVAPGQPVPPAGQALSVAEQRVLFSGFNGIASTAAIYTVADIAIDERADNATDARQRAISRARQMAFAQLVRRLSLDDDIANLPYDLTDQEIAQLVAGFEVAKEKSSVTRYLADFTVRFDPDAIRALLRRNNVRFSETAAAPLIIVPLADIDGTRLLWEPGNRWRDALVSAIAEEPMALQGLRPLRLPRGDVADQMALDIGDALLADGARLAELSRIYAGLDVLIARAALTRDPVNSEIHLQVVAQPYSPHEQNSQTELAAIEFTVPQSQDIELLFDRAARQLVNRLQQDWKQRTRIEFGELGRITLNVRTQSLAQWYRLRRQLESIYRVREIQLLALSVQFAQMSVQYHGDIAQLQFELAQRDLNLQQYDNYWFLSPRQPALPAQPQQ